MSNTKKSVTGAEGTHYVLPGDEISSIKELSIVKVFRFYFEGKVMAIVAEIS